jgi:hypothetical protein
VNPSTPPRQCGPFPVAASDSDPLHIVYIAGAGRSGSTLLDRILGEIDGVFSTGEFRQVFDHAMLRDAQCGCGAPFAACPLWREVFHRAVGGMDRVDPVRLAAQRDSISPMRLRRAIRNPAQRADLTHRIADYLDTLRCLYLATASVTGSRVIVDSSKFPTYAGLLGLLGGEIRVSVVHLVRDPRGQAYSCGRPKAYLDRAGPIKAAVTWVRANLSAEWLPDRTTTPYCRLRFEDLLADPHTAIGGLLAFVGKPDARLPFSGPRSIVFGRNHTVGGNVDRFQDGETELRLDDPWRRGLRPAHRRLVTLLTLPLLIRYRYPVRAL